MTRMRTDLSFSRFIRIQGIANKDKTPYQNEKSQYDEEYIPKTKPCFKSNVHLYEFIWLWSIACLYKMEIRKLLSSSDNFLISRFCFPGLNYFLFLCHRRPVFFLIHHLLLLNVVLLVLLHCFQICN